MEFRPFLLIFVHSLIKSKSYELPHSLGRLCWKGHAVDRYYYSRTQGQSVGSGEKAGWKFSSTGERAPSIDSHRAISKNSSGCRLLIGHKKCFVLLCPIGEQFLLSSFREFVHDGYCLHHGLSGSCTEMHAVRKLSVSNKIPIWFQNTVYPKTKDARFSKNTSLSLQQVSKLASITSCINIKEFLKDTTTTSVSIVISRTHLLSQMQANSSGAEFLSTIFKFMKRMNFVIAYLRPSQNMTD